VPVFALAGTAVGEYLASRGTGWCLTEPLEVSLTAFLAQPTADEYRCVVERLATLGQQPFVESTEIADICALLSRRERARVAEAEARR
jgi:hypothetical protein